VLIGAPLLDRARDTASTYHRFPGVAGSGRVKDRGDVVFITAALVLVAGVPVALYSVHYFAESVQLLATALLILLVLVSLIGLVVVRNWDRIIAKLVRKPVELSQGISTPLSRSLSLFAQGQAQAAES